MEEELKQALNQAITDFNNIRSDLLKAAYQNGGQPEVDKLEAEYDSLRNAYFDLVKKQLDKNNGQYLNLINSTRSETEKLNNSLKDLDKINNIIELTGSVARLVGTIIIVLA